MILPEDVQGATGDILHIGVVGAGPRGIIFLEQLVASVDELAPHRHVHVHLVDPEEAGAGRVFRSRQSRQLLMNTVCGDVTVFTDRRGSGERGAGSAAAPRPTRPRPAP